MPFDITSTTVEEVHEIICDDAVRIANDSIANDFNLGKKWRGGHPVWRNGVPYNEGRLVIEITEEYQSAGPRIKDIFREHGMRAIRQAILKHGELFAGMVFGEARAGRNYFNRHDPTPTRLFD